VGNSRETGLWDVVAKTCSFCTEYESGLGSVPPGFGILLPLESEDGFLMCSGGKKQRFQTFMTLRTGGG